MTIIFDWFSQTTWLAYVLAYVIGGLVLSVLEYFLSYRLYPVYERKAYYLNMALASALHWPAQVYIWLSVILLAAPKILTPMGIVIAEADITTAFHLATAVALFWFCMRFIRALEQSFYTRIAKGVGKISDKTQIGAVALMARVIVIALFLLVLLPIFGIPTAALLTFGGATTIVVGLATQDSLANFLGGLMIYWDRPFSVGDWIRSPDKNIEGTVEDIGWRLTRIRTFDKRPLYVPNRVFSTISIENASRMTNRRIKHSIGVRYADVSKMAAITADIKAMLLSHPDLDHNQTTMVNFDEYAESSLNFLLYAFTKTTKWAAFKEVQQDVLLKVHEIIERHDAECAFPTRTFEFPAGIAINADGE